MAIHEIEAKTVLHYHKRKTATHWDINIYRGCGHGCRYCFARYTHDYVSLATPSDNSFFQEIFVKTNAPQVLERQLRSARWKGDPITIGGVSDSYQPIEGKYRIMPEILRIMIKHRNPIVISTKSTRIFRDLPLFERLAQVCPVHVGVSVSTMDPSVQQVLEPNASPTMERLELLRAFRKIGCATSVLMMPILPWITDSYENLEGLIRMAHQVGAQDLISGSLRLRGHTRKVFFRFLDREYSGLKEKYQELYAGEKPSKPYRSKINCQIHTLINQYPLNLLPKRVKQTPQPSIKPEQLRLF